MDEQTTNGQNSDTLFDLGIKKARRFVGADDDDTDNEVAHMFFRALGAGKVRVNRVKPEKPLKREELPLEVLTTGELRWTLIQVIKQRMYQWTIECNSCEKSRVTALDEKGRRQYRRQFISGISDLDAIEWVQSHPEIVTDHPPFEKIGQNWLGMIDRLFLTARDPHEYPDPREIIRDMAKGAARSDLRVQAVTKKLIGEKKQQD